MWTKYDSQECYTTGTKIPCTKSLWIVMLWTSGLWHCAVWYVSTTVSSDTSPPPSWQYNLTKWHPPIQISQYHKPEHPNMLYSHIAPKQNIPVTFNKAADMHLPVEVPKATHAFGMVVQVVQCQNDQVDPEAEITHLMLTYLNGK